MTETKQEAQANADIFGLCVGKSHSESGTVTKFLSHVSAPHKTSVVVIYCCLPNKVSK